MSRPGLERLRRPSLLNALGLASVVANTLIVLTGATVRLSSSGLGCPTWPRCTDSSLVPTAAATGHTAIEFSNRMLTFVLVVIAIATLVAALIQRRERRLALIAFLGIPAQALLGGVTVLTELNPWAVGGHFLLSMLIIAVTFALWSRLRDTSDTSDGDTGKTGPSSAATPLLRLLTTLVGLAVIAVLVIGTVVTGSGPHAGDIKENGRLHRNGLSSSAMSQLHADAVMLLIGLTIGLVVLTRLTAAGSGLRRAARDLLIIELAQGAIGFVQYFTHLPSALVAVHVLGACLVWLATLRLFAALGFFADHGRPTRAGGPERSSPRSAERADQVDQNSDQGPHDGAVDADELQVTPHL